MKKSFLSRLAFLGLILGLGQFAMSQSFQVTGRTFTGDDALTLDGTTIVNFQVLGSSTTGTTIVPELVVSSSEPSFVQAAIQATWNGNSAISNWTSGSTQTLTFFVHLYEDSNVCGREVDFTLRLNVNGGTVNATGASSFFTLGSPSSDLLTLHTLVSDNVNSFGVVPVGTSNNFTTAMESVPSSVINNANNRVYLYMVYDIQPTPPSEYFLNFLYPLNNDCLIQLQDDVFPFESSLLVDALVVDETGTVPEDLTLAPLGGGGVFPAAFGEGINLWDITDVGLTQCSGSVKQAISATGISPGLPGTFRVGFLNRVVRDFKIYLGTQGTCSADVFNFGGVPSDFEINSFFISSIGEVEAELSVPNSWETSPNSGILKPGYLVQWFLRSGSTMVSLGSGSTDLSLSRDANVAVDTPDEFFLEARVQRTSTNSWVSTDNRGLNHEIEYTLLTPTYDREEQNFATGASDPDDFFDPGEVLNIPVFMNDPNGSFVGGSLDNGYVIDQNDNGQVDPTVDRFVSFDLPLADDVNIRILPIQSSRGSQTVTFSYELLTAPNNKTVWFYFDSTASNNGVSSTFRRYIQDLEVSAGLNGEDAQLTFSYPFTSTNGNWVANNQTTGTGLGWNDNTPWFAQGGNLPQHGDDVNGLESPPLPVGRSVSASFNHTPNFTFNQSGGLLEYRMLDATRQPLTGWSDFITNACTTCNIYDPLTFPDNFSSYLAGKELFMGMDSSNRTEFVNNIPDSFFNGFVSGEDQIQFRFVFQEPSLDPQSPDRSDGPTQWTINNFSYSANLFQDDNVFGVDFDSLFYDDCNDPFAIVFSSPSVNPEDLNYEWYEDLNDLYDGVSVNGGQAVPFSINSDDEQFYVRLKYVHPTQGTVTERILGMNILNGVSCPPPDCLTQPDAIGSVLEDASISWPSAKTIQDCVQVINQICPPE